MKKLLFTLLLLPLFAFPQSEKRYRSIIIDSVKALNGGILDVKDIIKIDTTLRISDGETIEFLSGISTGVFKLDGVLTGDVSWLLPGFTGTFALGTGTTNRITSWSGTNIIENGTWAFSTNTLHPITDGSNIGVTATNRVASMFMDASATLDFATTLIFDEAGSERMRILTGGNVGIGTITPATKLDVTGDINGTNVQTGTTGNVTNWTTVKIFNDSTMTADGSVVGLLPAGYIIDNIIFKNTTGSSITQFDIGFTAGGGEIVANGNISGNSEGSFTILQRIADFDAADEIFFDANSFNGSTLIIYIKMSRIF